jgi:hypothetical protein
LGLLLVAAAVVLWFLYREFAFTGRTLEERPRQLVVFGAAYVVFLASTLAVWRAQPRMCGRWALLIIVAGLLFRVTVAPVHPATSSDIYRYVWEGRVVRAGANPYSHAPRDPELEPLRNWVWPLVQHKSVPAAYPPVAQYVFLLATFVPLDPIIALKLVLACFDMLTVLLLVGLLRQLERPPAWVICYAWHPLTVCELVARGHLDSVGIFFLVLTVRLLLAPSARRRALSGATLALSILSKGYALVAAPFLLRAARPHWRPYFVGFALAGAIVYVPFVSAGPDLFRGLSEYAARWYGNASIFALVRLALTPLSDSPDGLARAICALGLAGWVAFLLLKGRRSESLETSLRLSQQALPSTPGTWPGPSPSCVSRGRCHGLS